MYVCLCNAVSEGQIRASVEDGACTLGDLERCLGVGTDCGRCRNAARQMLHEMQTQGKQAVAGVSA